MAVSRLSSNQLSRSDVLTSSTRVVGVANCERHQLASDYIRVS
jgi:hypothetical protein